MAAESDNLSSLLQFDKNPKRRLMVFGVFVLLVLALIIVAAHAIRPSSGCTAILATQRYGCIASLAGQTGNALICDQIGNAGMRNSCIMSVAEASRSTAACSAFPDGPQRNSCIENVSYSASNPLLCDGLDSHNQSICRYTISQAANFSVPTYCGGIHDPYYRGLCGYQSIYHIALSTGNYSYCGGLPATPNATLTYAMGIQDSSYPASYGLIASFSNVTPRDFCYSSIPATASSNSCIYISNSTLRSACNISANPSNSSLSLQNETAGCANASTPQLMDLCYFGVYTNQAVKTSNESWCGLITNQSYLTSCVVNLASAKGNVTYCGTLQNQSSRQSCIYETQLASGNYS